MLTEITEQAVRRCLRPRGQDAHKGQFGRALLVVGSYGMAGAAILAARGALRCGVGIAEIAVPHRIYPIVASAVPEAVFSLYDDSDPSDAVSCIADALRRADAVLIGCGLGRTPLTEALVDAVIRHARCPIILDADGINVFAAHILVPENARTPLILTPHAGEMARLTGLTAEQVQANRERIAAEFSARHGVWTVLKGHGTLIASPDGELWRNPTGNAGMATGGSGDVLAGMTVGLAAQGMPPCDTALCAVYVHGAAGDRAAAALSERAMLPSDLIDRLSEVFSHFEK